VIRIAKKYRFDPREVRDQLEEFRCHDTRKRGLLSRAEFILAVRERLGLASDAELPDAIVHEIFTRVDSSGDESIDFEEFVVWAQTAVFSEFAVVVANPDEKQIREMSRAHSIPISLVEKIWDEFRRTDLNGNRQIEKHEFFALLRVLHHSKDQSAIPEERLVRYWQDADIDHDGAINFQEFLLWYHKYFGSSDGSGTQKLHSDGLCPASSVYRKLGQFRLTEFHRGQEEAMERDARAEAEVEQREQQHQHLLQRQLTRESSKHLNSITSIADTSALESLEMPTWKHDNLEMIQRVN